MSVSVVRWIFHDPTGADTDWTVPVNPNAMTSPYPKKNFIYDVTTAIDGVGLVWQGQTKPVEWSFSGEILDQAHYDKLSHWVYDKDWRIKITDHFGRVFTVALTSFEPVPKRAVNVYWRHQYIVNALVFKMVNP